MSESDWDFWFDISMLWVGTFFYGIYLILFCLCIYILLHRPHNLGNIVLLVTAIVLFTFSTVQTVINLVLGASDIDNIDIPYHQIFLANAEIFTFNNVVADGLLIYRCYSIWNKNIYVVLVPIIMLIITSILGWDILLPFTPFFALTLATNVIVTVLTAGRIWWLCRKAQNYLQTDLQRRYLSAISILVESGVAYSAAVLAYLIFGAFESTNIMQEPIWEALAQLVGIVPTLIIVRVGMGVSVQSFEPTAKAATSALTASETVTNTVRVRPPIRKAVPYYRDKELPPDLEKGTISKPF
ncbi:hypothetical protein GGX14DRAFT_446149 [Mycena pura]|uniref:Uncharacterized protein n=1 Tax=Mycena pura TaxID=153505 RepID=A0AAD6VLF6_9AGAR|nr:hypothetical protein GGX14DRAFT_446149 [Mycena pura]